MLTTSLLREVAGDLVTRLELSQHGNLRRLTLVEPETVGPAFRTTRVEPAAGRWISEIRRGAADAGQALTGPAQRREGREQPARVRVERVRPEAARLRGLDDRARVHDRDPVRGLDQQREIVRDEEHRKLPLPLKLLNTLQDLALDDDVQCRRGLIEDDQLGLERQRHRDDHALAHATRQLVRIRAHALPVHAHQLEQVPGLRQRLLLRDPLVRLHHVDELVADPGHRIQRVHRRLEDDRDVPPAELPQLLFAIG